MSGSTPTGPSRCSSVYVLVLELSNESRTNKHRSFQLLPLLLPAVALPTWSHRPAVER